jgi:4-hydroxy-2-oxoheptanedioate aldolase
LKSIDLIKAFRTKLKEQACFGIFSKTTDSSIVEAAGYSGLDFIIIDMEHGPVSLEIAHNHARASLVNNMLPIIRVKDVDAHSIGSALDAGALGVQVPNISNASQAREAVNAARFYPDGMRGVCRYVKAANFGSLDKQLYFEQANQSLLILQVEGVEGIKNLDEILSVKGFDILFIGPYDLSQSIGKPGQVNSPEVLALMQKIAKKSLKKNIILGAFSDSLNRNRSLKNEGFNYIAHSVDINIYLEACQKIVRGS